MKMESGYHTLGLSNTKCAKTQTASGSVVIFDLVMSSI